jgi:hypothetical protein
MKYESMHAYSYSSVGIVPLREFSSTFNTVNRERKPLRRQSSGLKRKLAPVNSKENLQLDRNCSVQRMTRYAEISQTPKLPSEPNKRNKTRVSWIHTASSLSLCTYSWVGIVPDRVFVDPDSICRRANLFIRPLSPNMQPNAVEKLLRPSKAGDQHTFE